MNKWTFAFAVVLVLALPMAVRAEGIHDTLVRCSDDSSRITYDPSRLNALRVGTARNPAGADGSVWFDLGRESWVDARVITVSGRICKTLLVHQYRGAGTHTVTLGPLPTGTYFVQVSGDGLVRHAKVTIIR